MPVTVAVARMSPRRACHRRVRTVCVPGRQNQGIFPANRVRSRGGAAAANAAHLRRDDPVQRAAAPGEGQIPRNAGPRHQEPGPVPRVAGAAAGDAHAAVQRGGRVPVS